MKGMDGQMTGQELLETLQKLTPEQLAEPIEVAVQTYTREYPRYAKAFDFKIQPKSRIYCAFPKGVTISVRKDAK